MSEFDVIIVGAGPAGLLAAGRAAELGGKVLILEKMRLPSRKLLLTGKGRCNITNNAEISECIKHIFPNGRFLRPAFSNYFSNDIIELLNRYGVDTILSRGGRYFPASDKSADVLNALLKWIDELSIEIRCGHRAEKLIIENNIIKGLQANGRVYETKKIILATGGKSYPATGSNGEGYELVRRLGHTIIKPMPALVPLETEGGVAQKLQGLNLKNVKAAVWVNNKKIAEEFGEMLFTHFGLSGPIILTLSRTVVMALQQKNKVEISIDLKPALDETKLDNRLLRDLNEHGKKQIGNVFSFWLPASMIPVFIELLEIDPEKKCHQVSANERRQIRYLLKNLCFKVSHYRSFKEAIITAGGVSIKEISPKTMESKLIKGLYFAGEMIDLDAETGGYNLQIAFSTGWLAGNSCMRNQ
ncbi:MAG TPA: NAD(P)/FAD-dependent oxidoreductase [Caldithrix sp.]|nr:NAD(P)/FAD-dependent oxidoreductase [Caldithrix sp.]